MDQIYIYIYAWNLLLDNSFVVFILILFCTHNHYQHLLHNKQNVQINIILYRHVNLKLFIKRCIDYVAHHASVLGTM